MDKNLPDNIDKFFLRNLKDYGEEPNDNVWAAIDKRLSDREQKRKPFTWKTISFSAAIIVGLLMPFILKDVLVLKKLGNEKSANSEPSNRIEKPDKSVQDFGNLAHDVAKIHLSQRSGSLIYNKTNSIKESNLLTEHLYKRDDSIAIVSNLLLPKKIFLKEIATPYKLKDSLIMKDDVANMDQSNSKKNSTVITLSSKKHKVEIIPFFSFDHISGRFIEQYEFDNEHTTDYTKRENADMSFTTGLLASFKINKKFSLISGVSFSKTSIAISSTAINALQDENGVYKFKLATTYGLAEIAKTGLTPTAGDSLYVSNGMMQLNYISIPALINYDFGNRKIKWSIHAGIALNKVLRDKVEVEYEINNNNDNETIDKIEGVKRTFFTINTGVEVKYSLSHFIDVGISPELRYGINSINKGTPVKTYPVNYGLATNIHLKL